MTTMLMNLIDDLVAAAQSDGWLSDQGTGTAPQEAASELERAKSALIAALTPAQAPDKAGEREGLDRAACVCDEQAALAHKLRDEQQAQDNDVGAGRWDLAAVALRDAASAIRSLAHQPTGTEASRGVGAETLRPLIEKEVREIRLWAESHESLETASDLDTVADNLEAALAATPTPPLLPDSTGPAGADWRTVRKALALAYDVGPGSNIATLRQACREAMLAVETLAALTPSAHIAAEITAPNGLVDAILSLAVAARQAPLTDQGSAFVSQHLKRTLDQASTVNVDTYLGSVLREERPSIAQHGDRIVLHRISDAAAARIYDSLEACLDNCPSAPIAAPVRDDGALEALRISFDMSLSPEGWLRVSGINPLGLILSSADHDALLSDIGPAIRGLLTHSGKWPPTAASIPAPAGDVPGEAQTRPDALGYVNVYREDDGSYETGCTDIYDTAQEAREGCAAEFATHLGVFALVPASVTSGEAQTQEGGR